MTTKPHIAVIGAGAFGGWTALHLGHGGARVTLLDAWGPGNSRASSGGETRVMRGAYGHDQASTEMAARALQLWEKYERRWKRTLLHRCGVLWMATGDDAFERGSVEMLRATKIKFQELSATKQDVFFFGTPAGDARFSDEHLPVWGDHRGRFLYGIPGHARRGFKVADDTRGPTFDPTSGERVISEETLQFVREYLAFRFPALKDAPLIETRVCQYEQTPDSQFIVDRHPAMENVWLVGGGSGHGFKHGPAMGEMMADLILKGGEPKAGWRLDRFKKNRS